MTDAIALLVLGVLKGLHTLYVAFVLLGPALMWIGIASNSRTLTGLWLAKVHLLCLLFICLQLFLDWPCPLTLIENYLTHQPEDTRFLPLPKTSSGAAPFWLWVTMMILIAVNLITQIALSRLAHR